MEFSVVENTTTGLKTVTAFFPNKAESLVQATSDHPHFTSIVRGLEEGDETVYGLFDVQTGVNQKFATVSNRYTVRDGVFYRDLVPMHNVLADQVVRFMHEGVDDWQPLVRFFERVDANPSEASREELYKWIGAGKLTITEDGMCVGYKSMNRDSSGGFVSTVAGYAVVNGVEHDKSRPVPNAPGAIVEMPRNMVDNNKNKHCSVGLHVGTWQYAKGYNGGKNIMEVHFDPADAVSVPTDDAGKIRVCRYRVVNIINAEHGVALRPAQDYFSVAQARQDVEYHDDKDAPDNW